VQTVETTITSIRKRDGALRDFDPGKIASALARAGAATGEFGEADAARLAAQVARVVAHRLRGRTPGIEDIQDAVEYILIAADFVATARAYIVYREQHKRLREDKRTVVDVAASMNEYLERQDWRVNANANQGYSLGGLILNVAGKVTANYWLSHVYPPEVGRAHREGDIHVHDLDMLAGYCAGWSLKTLIQEGLNGVPGKVEAAPPKHLSSAVGQIVNFLGTLQNEWAGAQAFSSFDTYMAPFVRKDRLSYAEVKQSIQELIYNLNVPSRWGTQTPFTNLTFDWTCPEDLKGQVPVIGGEEMPFTYGELAPEMAMINRAYIEVMTAGDAKGRVFTFPIPTYNITKDFDWDGPNTHALFAMTAKYGLPYFQNFVNSDLEPNMVRSMCCRLQLDLRELLKRGNGLFGSAEQTGSVGVVTVNCARLGYLFKGDEASAAPAAGPAPRDRPHEPRDQAEGHPAPHGRGAVSLHEALPRHAAQPLLHARRERAERDDPQLHRRRRGHHERVGPRIRLPPARPRQIPHGGVPGADGPSLQPRGDARRGHHLPLRQGGPQALEGHPAGGNARDALLHELLPAAGGLHRRSVRGARAPGGTAVEVHRRHGASPVHDRARELGGGLQAARAPRALALQAALHHGHADLLHLPEPRLPAGRARDLPPVRRSLRDLDARHGLPPARVVVQQGQAGRVPRAQVLRGGQVLRVGGLTRCSATDYPGKLAAVVYCQGCAWRCGYCHNPELQSARGAREIPWADVVSFLERRRGLLDAVVFSGGEPTQQPGLAAAMRQVREMGFLVGLHTAGIVPWRLEKVLPLADWVAMDAKAPFAEHERVTGVAGSARRARGA
jgi:anaerobic ribonucleoside-triphosphate reductase activating protein